MGCVPGESTAFTSTCTFASRNCSLVRSTLIKGTHLQSNNKQRKPLCELSTTATAPRCFQAPKTNFTFHSSSCVEAAAIMGTREAIKPSVLCLLQHPDPPVWAHDYPKATFWGPRHSVPSDSTSGGVSSCDVTHQAYTSCLLLCSFI